MASILKINNIQLPDGNNATTSDLGIASGSVIQQQVWRVPAVTVTTSGAWVASNVPTLANTYQAANYTFNKVSSTSKIVVQANGHVDLSGSTSAQTFLGLLLGDNTIVGGAYMHGRYQNTEPYAFCFSGEYQTSDLSPVFYLCSHSSGTSMHISSVYSGNYTQNPYTITFTEVEV